MGGFCAITQIYWFYQLSKEEVEILPVHFTEMWAELIQLALNGPELVGLRYLGYIDNQAAHLAILAQGTRDQRFLDTLLMRRHIIQDNGFSSGSALIPTDENNFGGALSRGQIKYSLTAPTPPGSATCAGWMSEKWACLSTW